MLDPEAELDSFGAAMLPGLSVCFPVAATQGSDISCPIERLYRL